MKPAVWKTRVSAVEEQIVKGMASGEFQPGEILPSIELLAVRFEVGRHTIVRALERLASHGLLRIEHGRGTLALNMLDCGSYKVLGEVLANQAQNRGLSQAAAEMQAFQWQSLKYVAKACLRASAQETPERLAALLDRLGEMVRVSAGERALQHAEFALWQGIASGAENLGCTWFVSSLRAVFRGPVTRAAGGVKAEICLRCYDALVHALEARSPGRVTRAMNELAKRDFELASGSWPEPPGEDVVAI